MKPYQKPQCTCTWCNQRRKPRIKLDPVLIGASGQRVYSAYVYDCDSAMYRQAIGSSAETPERALLWYKALCDYAQRSGRPLVLRDIDR